MRRLSLQRRVTPHEVCAKRAKKQCTGDERLLYMTGQQAGCLTGGGECGKVLRGIDWSSNPLGPPEGWPLSLQAAVRLILHSQFAMMVHWGPELITFYNDAYAPSLGNKHPDSLGRPAKEWWSEIWDDLQPIFDQVRGGEPFFKQNACYKPDRFGGAETAYFSHCHSPLWGDTGEIEGVFLVVTETTREVTAEVELQAALDQTAQQGRISAESDAYHRAIIDSSTDFAIIAMDRDATITRWNEGARRIMGWSEEEMLGKTAQRIFTAEDRADGVMERETRNAREAGHGTDERWHLRKDGSCFWAAGMMMPLNTAAGDHIGYLKILRDRTQERLAEERLREAREWLDVALQTGLIGFFEWDVEARRVKGDNRFADFLGFPHSQMAEGVALEGLAETIHPEDRLSIRENAQHALQTQTGFHAEFRLMANNSLRWIAVTGHRHAPDHQPLRYAGVVIDVTTQKRAEEVREVLSSELKHRVKNIIAVVQSVATQTFRGAETEKLNAFNGRLRAMAAAQDMLTQGGGEPTNVQAVVKMTLEPMGGGTDRFQIEGVTVDLAREKALPLSLAMHELATNAGKYGALSNRSGRVSIRWAISGETFRLEWSEQGGPTIRVPDRKGFGSRLIERVLAAEFSGKVQVDYRPDGLQFVFEAPAASLAA